MTEELAAVLGSLERRAALRNSATTPAACIHPSARLYAWWARDDSAPDGRVLCCGCMACGAVLAGAALEEIEV